MTITRRQTLIPGSATLGAGPFDAFARVASPLAVRGYISALVLAFAHTIGEFGVVLMVGGNIPGIAAEQPVSAEPPEIAGPAYNSIQIRHRGSLVLGPVTAVGRGC